MCSAFTRYSVYRVGTRWLCFPAFQHRGQRHLQIPAPRTAPGHSALTGALAAPNCCFHPPPPQHKTTFSSPVKTPPTPRCLRLEKYCSDFCDGRKDGRTRGRLDAAAGSGDVMVGLPLGVLRLRSF